MNKLLLLPLILFFAHSISAQNFWYEEHIPKFRSEIFDTINQKRVRMANIYRDLSFVGQMSSVDSLFHSTSNTDAKVLNEIGQCQPKNAIEYILEQAASHRIVMINESHCQPQERYFTSRLLEGLKLLGFTYLGLEAISSNSKPEFTAIPENKLNLVDTLIQERGYPLMKAVSGSYVKESQFGNLIREAIQHDVKIFGYENWGKQRELDQATNIMKILEQDSLAKIIIHCGGGHLNENLIGDEKKRMGTYLKELSGIDPFTIHQVKFSYSEDIYKTVSENYDFKEPVVLIDKTGEAFNGSLEGLSLFDVAVIHPRANYDNGRPNWMIQNPKLNKVSIDMSDVEINGPLRFKVLLKDDRLDAVPVDVYEPLVNQNTVDLYLPKGAFRLVVENLNQDRIIKNLEVK